MLGKLWDNRGTIAAIASHVVPFLLAEEHEENQIKPIVIKANYMHDLQMFSRYLEAVALDNPLFNLAEMRMIVGSEYDRVCKTRGRLVPLIPVGSTEDDNDDVNIDIVLNQKEDLSSQRERVGSLRRKQPN